jgi:uncharacterized protein YerC
MHTGDFRMTTESIKELVEVLDSLRGRREILGFLQDLLTPQEIERFAMRWQMMKLSAEGLSREEVQEAVGVSLSTISRGRRVVDHGTGIIKTLVERQVGSQTQTQ